MSCPCGAGPSYALCCGRYHRGEVVVPTAEALMRSRYCAFAVGDTAWLLRSWHSSTRPKRIDLDPGQVWDRLEVLGRTGGGLFDSDGTVEFRALFTHRGRTDALHENSRFTREHGLWTYVTALPRGAGGRRP